MLTDRGLDVFIAFVLLGILIASILSEQVGEGVYLVGHELNATCPFLRMAGAPCPFCGMSRSFVAIGDGRILDAIRYHPVGPIYFLSCLIGLGAIVFFAAARKGSLLARKEFRGVCYIITMGSIAVWVFRGVFSV